MIASKMRSMAVAAGALMTGAGITGAALLAGLAAHPAPLRAQAAPKAWAANCQSCHKADGSGMPGMFPRLSGRVGPMAGSKDARQWLISTVLYGQSGAITVDGKPIRGAMMPFGRLPDADVAAALNWVGKGGKPFTPAEVAAVRSAGGGSAAKNAEMRKKLEGAGQVR
ncbi:c-type cytochrome [Novosphingobium aerophilum]|uniref:c-type cytochrome n=1 Tax=Novosphingobium aerophilum TaxID=2839843 RepID=UPI003FD1726E